MPIKAPVKTPVGAPAFNWSGFYIGGYAGGAWSGRITASDMFSQGPDDPIVSDWSAFGNSYYNFKASFIGGATAGINWQAAGSPLVWGSKANWALSHSKATGRFLWIGATTSGSIRKSAIGTASLPAASALPSIGR